MFLACVGRGMGNSSVRVREGRARARGTRKDGKNSAPSLPLLTRATQARMLRTTFNMLNVAERE